jgi:hypothetical protein
MAKELTYLPRIDTHMGRGTTAGEVIAETLAALDVEAILLEGGLERADLSSLRDRLLPAATDRQ